MIMLKLDRLTQFFGYDIFCENQQKVVFDVWGWVYFHQDTFPDETTSV